MYPGVRLGEASIAINDQECQRIIRIVAVLDQQRSAQIALHGNQVKRWLARVTLQPPCPAATEVAQPIEDNYSAFPFHYLRPLDHAFRRGLPNAHAAMSPGPLLENFSHQVEMILHLFHYHLVSVVYCLKN
jgi:hypothetical protein